MRILLTGGTGRLGRELLTLLTNVVAPTRSQLDITQSKSVGVALARERPDVVLHAAAFTDVLRAEQDRDECWRVNVDGTRNIAMGAIAVGARFVHISTDYVFAGVRGMYVEDDPVGPPVNYYARTKIEAEGLVLAQSAGLVLRTSFRPRSWPYENAYIDAFTSQDYVDVIAPMIAEVVLRLGELPHRILHVATERKSAWDLAVRRRPDVRKAERAESRVAIPRDVSLDCERWKLVCARMPS